MAAAKEALTFFLDPVTHILIYTTEGNDPFTPNQWIKSKRKDRNTGGWNNDNTMSFL
jgi:hypothetical protein